MLALQDREKAFEAKLVLDDDLRFSLLLRRNRIVGQWAADLLGKTGKEAQTYVQDVVRISIERPEPELSVIRKLVSDLGNIVEESQIRSQLARADEEAKRLILEEQNF